MKRLKQAVALVVAAGILVLVVSVMPGRANDNGAKTVPAKSVVIDLDHASPVVLPRADRDLKPAAFKTADGKGGWVVRVPGGRPIATPAYADGLLFVGGGYGSHDFYAFNADTGELAWKIQTGDDGPTAAVAEGGYVAFNTESCTVIVVDEKTGKVIWQEWLGDPLMSQPAISKGRLFIAYPAGQRKGGLAPGHHLLAADLRTGKHLWEQEITGDVISAPVVDNEVVYLTCFDGTSFAINAADGKIIWKKAQSATAAPLVANGQIVVTRREQNGKSVDEGLARLDMAGDQKDRELLAKGKAEYLSRGNSGGLALKAAEQAKLDSSVGFSSAPAAAKLSTAEVNVGVSTVAGAWAYQGSRAAYSQGQVLNAQGRVLNSIRAADGAQTWRAEAKGANVRDTMQVFSPPALGTNYMYLTSSLGHILSIQQKDGSVRFNYSLSTPMVFQPSLVHGNIYAGTSEGLLICLKTGESDADGWYAWGGNAQHNKH